VKVKTVEADETCIGGKERNKHISAKHLKRYLGEFDYRFNERQALEVDDHLRMEKSGPGIVGKRLTYRRTCREGQPVRR
jgi:hypothetical protein